MPIKSPKNIKKIAYQGIAGAYSHAALNLHYPEATPLACKTFADALKAVTQQKADAAFLPFENSLAGGVTGMQACLPSIKNLYICQNIWIPIQHALVSLGDDVSQIEKVYSHPQALAQCSDFIKKAGLQPQEFIDTAAAAQFVQQQNIKSVAAICSAAAARVYGLNVLRDGIQNEGKNLTRFFLWAGKTFFNDEQPQENGAKTAFYLQARTLQETQKSLQLLEDAGYIFIKTYEIFCSAPQHGNCGLYAEYSVPSDTTQAPITDLKNRMSEYCDEIVWFGYF